MKYAFISGIPASGKSYLAEKIAKALKMKHFETDDWREEFRRDEHADWVDFFGIKTKRNIGPRPIAKNIGEIWFGNRRRCGRKFLRKSEKL
ncbi:MAG: hypothetical protein AUK17_00985 [Parcubacteria group bacterium CG2_30_44_18]|nr:MAG: hypothetical protein AUK17_00985 [Parcubacteria group bacterium CG2_30_44_18]